MPVSEKSKQNLSKGRRFSSADGSAQAAGKKSLQVRQQQARAQRELDKMAQLLLKQMTLREFQQQVNSDKVSQAMRIFALNASQPATAMNTMDWLFNRILGKPKQITEATLDAEVSVTKPVIIFKDVADGSDSE